MSFMTSQTTSSGEHFADVGEIQLCYETFGSPEDPPLLLIMGLATQMVWWEDGFCQQLAERGFCVTRYDNRDIGRSTVLKDKPVPSRRQLFMRDRKAASYALDDMADDGVKLLDHLGATTAHVVGISMGGMIAQLVAMRHPDRVRSLVSIMSTTGNRRVGGTDPRLLPRLLRPPKLNRASYVADAIENRRIIGSKIFPAGDDRVRALAERSFERGLHPDGAARHLAAIVTAPDRTPRLRQLDVPTTVIHGTADRLVKPSGGRATAAAIPEARLMLVDGMAHDIPPVLWPRVIDAIVETAERAAAASRR
jgi:pimeloyl-ACP methyl ester carboxylesterase